MGRARGQGRRSWGGWQRRPRGPLKHPSPAAARRSGDVWRARVGLVLVVVIFIVAGFLLYARLQALRSATTPAAAWQPEAPAATPLFPSAETPAAPYYPWVAGAAHAAPR